MEVLRKQSFFVVAPSLQRRNRINRGGSSDWPGCRLKGVRNVRGLIVICDDSIVPMSTGREAQIQKHFGE